MVLCVTQVCIVPPQLALFTVCCSRQAAPGTQTSHTQFRQRLQGYQATLLVIVVLAAVVLSHTIHSHFPLGNGLKEVLLFLFFVVVFLI